MTWRRSSAALAMIILLPLGAPERVSAQVAALPGSASRFVTVGIFIASIEEGARIFTPVRLLPYEHAEALGHDFPTVLQLHGGEDRLLAALGRSAGLLLATTLQRYPTEPDTAWPYLPFERPPAAGFEGLAPTRRPAASAPLPGLRAVAFLDAFPLAFIFDTRGLSLTARGMERATSSGLDVSRAQVVSALTAIAATGPREGAWVVVFDRR
jgi:hypothetical protein